MVIIKYLLSMKQGQKYQVSPDLRNIVGTIMSAIDEI